MMKFLSIVLLAVAFAGCAVARPDEGGGYYAPPVNVGIGLGGGTWGGGGFGGGGVGVGVGF
jgi:hypothetical protein